MCGFNGYSNLICAFILPEFPRIIDNFRMYRYTLFIYDRERKAMSDEESDSTGDHNPNCMTGYFLKHIICLC